MVLEKGDVKKEIAHGNHFGEESGGTLSFERQWSQPSFSALEFVVILGANASRGSSRISTGQPGRVTWALFLSANPPRWALAPTEDSVCYLINVFKFFLKWLEWLL